MPQLKERRYLDRYVVTLTVLGKQHQVCNWALLTKTLGNQLVTDHFLVNTY